MNQSISIPFSAKKLIGKKKGKVGVVRNPYERLVALYIASFEYIGFKEWLNKYMSELSSQVSLYSDHDWVVPLDSWMYELNEMNVQHPDTSQVVLAPAVIEEFECYYDSELRDLVASLVLDDCTTYGYTFRK